jgi:anti-sigma factor RsiW
LSATVVHLDPDAHQALMELIPWYVTGRLAPEQRIAVEVHLAGCARCQAEVEAERRLRALAATPESPHGNPEDALARLRRRIDTERGLEGLIAAGDARRAMPAELVPRSSGLRFWQWAVGLQSALIAGLVVALSVTLLLPSATYRALGAPTAATGIGNAVVKFRADASDAQIRAALKSSGARIVNGPTASDAYVLSVPAPELTGAVARLRGDPAVLLAESLEGKAPP